MISIVDLKRAQKCIVSEISMGRCLVLMHHDLNILQNLTEDDLNVFVLNQSNWRFQKPQPIQIPKSSDGDMRMAYYIPVLDRLIILAAFMSDYNKVYNAVEPFNGHVNFDRPLPADPDHNFMDFNYRPAYQGFKQKLWDHMAQSDYLLHTDIRTFADSCDTNYMIRNLRDIGMNDASIDVVERAFDTWKASDISGIIQGYSFTDLMLKVYMFPIDKIMSEKFSNVGYYRYVDDIVLASDNCDDLFEALSNLQTVLQGQKLSLKRRETRLQHPGTNGLNHAYDPVSVMKTIDIDNRVNHIVYGGDDQLKTHPDALCFAYDVYVNPHTRQKDSSKYLISYILREMRKSRMSQIADDIVDLMNEYLQRVEKLLRAAQEIKPESINGLSQYFFNDDNCDDPLWDSRRLDYMKRWSQKFGQGVKLLFMTKGGSLI
jgi:hypothetical protein